VRSLFPIPYYLKAMKIEEKVQAALEQIKTDVAEKAKLEAIKAQQKLAAIAEKKATVLEWLAIAGVDESAVQWADQEFNISERLHLSVVISGIEIPIRSDAGLFDHSNQWEWANPTNAFLYIDDRTLCKDPEELESALVATVAYKLAIQQEIIKGNG
jgi:hypothetical protein